MLVALSHSRLQPSTVVDPLTGENKIAEHRNSEGMFFRLQETQFIATLDKRISEVMNCPIENGEGLQVLRYGPGAKRGSNRCATMLPIMSPTAQPRSRLDNIQVRSSGEKLTSIPIVR